jgi:hypothetical protein
LRQPDDIRAQLVARFNEQYPSWARGQGNWPLRIPLRPPTTRQRADDPIACHEWAAAWADYDGPGRIEHISLRFPTGTHPLPNTLVIDRAADLATIDSLCQRTWQQCGRRLIALQTAFGDATFAGVIRKITDLPEDDYQRLYSTVMWLRANPTSGLLLRQLPIEGIDTKWLERHAYLVLAMLGEAGDDDRPTADPATNGSPRRRLHERLGLRLPPELVQIAVLDPGLRSRLGGMRHFAASTEDLNQWDVHPAHVIILENKETGYAFTDDILDTVVFHGNGFNVATYAHIAWVPIANVVYWGDIDALGLQFVNDLRAYGIPARTVLMDTVTLDRYHHLTTDGAGPQRTTLKHLTDPEQHLYTRLADHASANSAGLLLEQERIPWPHAYQELLSAATAAPAHRS